MFTVREFIAGYFIFISLVSIILTVYDKAAAKRKAHRIPENTLIYIGVLGGAAAEYITMLIIRHKTLHKKFMIGLPVIFILQAAAVYLLYSRGLLG